MTTDGDRRLLTRVVLRNYKSIKTCDIAPSQVAFLVGPNGSGKSNFLDALRFVAESLRSSIDHALRGRGGINDVRRRSGGHPNHFGIRLEYRIDKHRGHYAFTVAAKPSRGWEIRDEHCEIWSLEGAPSHHHYRVNRGNVQHSSLPSPPRAHASRLYLVTVSGIEPFGHVYDAFGGMGFYNLIPSAMRSLQDPDPGELLARDGSNAPSVLANLAGRSPVFKHRVEEYLERIVHGVVRVDPKSVGPMETLEFGQEVKGARHPWRFGTASMSDGTLRAFGVLLALFQAGGDTATNGQTLVGIEKPELALHPAAAGVLLDAIREASRHSQVLVTSHSADLLDNLKEAHESVFAVVAESGVTHIGPLDEAGRSTLKKGLFTAGELLRVDQLIPDPKSIPQQLRLFRSLDPPG